MSRSPAAHRVRDAVPVRLDPAGPLAARLDRSDAFVVEIVVSAEEIDAFDHANNTAYQRWMEACAWAHSAAAGLPPERCRELGRGMALRRLEIDFLRPSRLGARVWVAVWIVAVDRLRAERRFQAVAADGLETLARACGAYVCIDLASGAPARMPPEFVSRYVVTSGPPRTGPAPEPA